MDTATETQVPAAAPLFKKRTAKANARKRPATPPPASDSSESGYTSSEDERGQRIKRRKKTAIVNASSTNPTDPSQASATAADLTASTFTADRSTTLTQTNDATKQSNWFDEKDEAQLLGSSSRQKKANGTSSKPATTTDSTNDGTTYKGRAAYSTHLTTNPNAPPSSSSSTTTSSKTVGPVKAPTNIRTITVTDFAPDVCKDYKQTGFCGFGDSCKFLHAREDYKQGWQLDRDWEIGGGGGKKGAGKKGEGDGGGGDGKGDLDEEEKLLEKIPFACIICKEGYKNPIVTKCGHYFCEGCALGRYKKGPSCAACGAGTNGVFNGAKQLRKLLERKRERARERKQKAREKGEEVSSDDDDDREVDVKNA